MNRWRGQSRTSVISIEWRLSCFRHRGRRPIEVMACVTPRSKCATHAPRCNRRCARPVASRMNHTHQFSSASRPSSQRYSGVEANPLRRPPLRIQLYHAHTRGQIPLTSSSGSIAGSIRQPLAHGYQAATRLLDPRLDRMPWPATVRAAAGRRAVSGRSRPGAKVKP
jgi:hypothetical protein